MKKRAAFSQGTSLFEEISPNRTCPEAYIMTHWCPCQTFDVVDVNSSESVNASQAIVDDINYKLESYGGMCEILEIAEILDSEWAKLMICSYSI
ncbi:hypothetical protein CDAR_263891 [Caerostris darwini]|uniref:Uncharacterized protein n=1 Tax=Caerostris darwini TaxID=1538125 RepID=A0AAV4RD07_9ARAC|nr:hypothetical protein CDAR_263891 [Caerostris darwini]